MDDQLLLFEEQFANIVAGADEAGRGPLAGPVCAACVVLPKDFPFEILNDSKKLSQKKREEAEIIIKQRSIAWSVAFVSAQEIDRINILNASLLAMEKAYHKLGLNADILLVDGNKKPNVDIPCKAIVKGDSLVHEIMAASILAKTARDTFMLCADKKWSMYNFAKHKGYPTKEHIKNLIEYGPCPIHRLTFKY